MSYPNPLPPILRDENNNPVPQFWDNDLQDWRPYDGSVQIEDLIGTLDSTKETDPDAASATLLAILRGSLATTASLKSEVDKLTALINDGALKTALTGRRMEIARYGPDNLLGSGSFHSPRDTTTRTALIPHASAGVVEQTIFITHDLDADLSMNLQIIASYGQGEQSSYATRVWPSTVIKTGARVHLAPQKSASADEAETPQQQIFEVVELAMPHERFQLASTPLSTPTTGSLYITIVRWY